MAKKIVEYDIDNNGNCEDCKSNHNWVVIDICTTFNDVICFGDGYQQCPACKDFLAQEASKVYCKGCKYLKSTITYGDCGVVYTDDVKPYCNHKQNEEYNYTNRKNEYLPHDEKGYYCPNCKLKKQV